MNLNIRNIIFYDLVTQIILQINQFRNILRQVHNEIQQWITCHSMEVLASREFDVY